MNMPYLLASPASPAPYAPPLPAARGKSDEDEFVLADLFNAIVDQIGWVIGAIILTVSIAAAYAFLASPIYTADALLQVELPNQNTIDVGTHNQVQPPLQVPPTQGEIELMKSRAVLAPVVKQFGLDVSITPRTLPVLGTLAHRLATPGQLARPWLGLRSYAWGGEQLQIPAITVPLALEDKPLVLHTLTGGRYRLSGPDGRVLVNGQVGRHEQMNGISVNVTQLIARPGTEFTVIRYNELNAVFMLAKNLQIAERSKDTGIVQISLDGPNPFDVTDITNAVVTSYLSQHIAHRQEEASTMLNFLQGELPHFREKLAQAEDALAEYQAKMGSMQPTVEAQTYLQGGLDYARQIAALKLQRTQLLSRFTPEHPQVQALDQQLAQLENEKNRFDERFHGLPADEREAVALQRNQKVAEEIYITLLNRTQELSVNRAGMLGNVHVVDRAMWPSDPVKPKRGLILGIAAIFGLIGGIAIVFVRRNFLTGVESPEFVERSMHLPIFGSVLYSVEQGRLDDRSKLGKLPPRPLLPGSGPHTDHRSLAPRATMGIAKPLLAKSRPHDMSIETLRSFRTALQFSMADAPNQIVALTGPGLSIGKSFLAANLGVLFAEAGQRVLLVDADMRRGHLDRYFGQSNKGGLSELLTDQIDLTEALHQTSTDGLYFISSGAYPPNPSEILMSPRTQPIFEQLDQQFDLVIVDTPPVLAVTDAAIVAHMAGTTVLVLRSGTHTEREISEAIKKLRRAGARLMGGVFNAVPPKTRHSAARYDHIYNYAYRYEPTV